MEFESVTVTQTGSQLQTNKVIQNVVPWDIYRTRSKNKELQILNVIYSVNIIDFKWLNEVF